MAKEAVNNVANKSFVWLGCFKDIQLNKHYWKIAIYNLVLNLWIHQGCSFDILVLIGAFPTNNYTIL